MIVDMAGTEWLFGPVGIELRESLVKQKRGSKAAPCIAGIEQ
jgi:hypothetical protein